MKVLQVKNGDIVKDTGGKPVTLVGSSKLVQDLTLWFQEQFGIGFTTPNFGSILYSLVGQPLTQSTYSQVYNEVQRIMGLYTATQGKILRQAQQSSQLGYWNKSEIIQSVNSITISQTNSTINIQIFLTTLASSSVTLNISVNPNGVQVQNG